MEPGEPALDVYLLPVTLAVWPALGGDVTLWAGSGAAGVTIVLVRVGLTGADAATTGAGGVGCWATDVRRAGTGTATAGVVVVAGAEVTVVALAGVVGADVVAVAVVVPDADAASFALFSCLILSISSSSLAAGRVGGGAGLGAAGFGAGGGVSFFFGRRISISRSLSL